MKVRMFCRYTLIALLNFTLISASFAQRADMKIAFVSTRDGNREIYVMDADGKNLKNLTNSPGNDIFPVWSPHGKKIAYISGNLGDENSLEVFVMNADGSNPKNLTKNRAEEFEWPAWSPDGKKIAFQSYRDFNGEIYFKLYPITVGRPHPANYYDTIHPANLLPKLLLEFRFIHIVECFVFSHRVMSN